MERRTPLARGTTPLKRVPIARVGKVAKRDATELAAARPTVLARSGGICEICRAAKGVLRHHKIRRSRTRQPNRNHPDNLLDLCDPCHRRVHRDIPWALALGYLISPEGTP